MPHTWTYYHAAPIRVSHGVCIHASSSLLLLLPCTLPCMMRNHSWLECQLALGSVMYVWCAQAGQPDPELRVPCMAQACVANHPAEDGAGASARSLPGHELLWLEVRTATHFCACLEGRLGPHSICTGHKYGGFALAYAVPMGYLYGLANPNGEAARSWCEVSEPGKEGPFVKGRGSIPGHDCTTFQVRIWDFRHVISLLLG